MPNSALHTTTFSCSAPQANALPRLKFRPRRALALAGLAAVTAGLALPAQALEYLLGGAYRAMDDRNNYVQDYVPSAGLNASHSNGSTWFGPNETILVSNFAASRAGGSLTSGVVVNEQNPDPGTGTTHWPKATARSLMIDDQLSFAGVTGTSFVTLGYRFQSVIAMAPAIEAGVFNLQSNLWGRFASVNAMGQQAGPDVRVDYAYLWDRMGGGMLEPQVILNGVQGQPPLTSFSYEGTVNLLLTPSFNTVRIEQLAATSEAWVNGVEIFHGATIANGIDLWIEGFGQPGISLAGSLSGHDYAYVPAPAIPEPGTLWMLGGGVLLMGLWKRRQQRPQVRS
jgi:hypothetical protein